MFINIVILISYNRDKYYTFKKGFPMNVNDILCISCSIKSSAVSVLNKEELCFLEKGCSKNKFKKGELIFKEGSPADYIIYVREGFVKHCKTGFGGNDIILSIAKKGAYLSIQNITGLHTKNYFSAVAISEVEVCFIATECFLKLLKQNGHFAVEIISYIFTDEMNYFDRLINNVQQQITGRLAGSLLYFKNQLYNQNPYELNITKSELASLLGTSRESVSRILKDFQDMKIISMNKNNIEILNENKLNEIKRKG